jgi:organic hydroperoxide reductase OsmC/OhrA
MSLPSELEYDLKLVWDKRSGGVISFRDMVLNLDMSIAFGGGGRFPCPDEFFFAAVGGCYLTTFLYFKEKLKLKLHDLLITVRGVVNYMGPRGYRIQTINLTIALGIDQIDRSRAIECLDYTQQFCHLTRSIEDGIQVNVAVDVRDVEA